MPRPAPSFTITSFTLPGPSEIIAGINNRGEVAGVYGSSGGDLGFIYDNGTVTTLNAPGATDTDPEAINDRGEVAGTYVVEPTATFHGFVYDDGTFTTLDAPGAYNTRALALNDRGEVAGLYEDSSGQYGFVYDHGTYRTLSVPGASIIAVEAINDRGEVAGYYIDSSGVSHGFVYDNGTYTTLNVPGASATFATAINDRGEVAGYYDDSSGEHDFVYDNGRFTTLNVPGAVGFTNVVINNRGEVAGAYEDSSGTKHGFLATPGGGGATTAHFGELLAHARQGGVNDLLPRIPGTRGESPHSTKTSGTMDHEFATGGRFAPFGGLESDHSATQAFLHSNGTSLGVG
jgi:probable HAF family extracellular repeat protein